MTRSERWARLAPLGGAFVSMLVLVGMGLAYDLAHEPDHGYPGVTLGGLFCVFSAALLFWMGSVFQCKALEGRIEQLEDRLRRPTGAAD